MGSAAESDDECSRPNGTYVIDRRKDESIESWREFVICPRLSSSDNEISDRQASAE